MKLTFANLYKQTGTNPETHTLYPSLDKIDGEYPGFFMTNFIVGACMFAYHLAEKNHNLIEKDGLSWCSFANSGNIFNTKDDDDERYFERCIKQATERGWLTIEKIDNDRCFSLSERILDIELYKQR